MDDVDALFAALRRAADLASADAVEALLRTGSDEMLARINPLALAAAEALDEDAVIATFVQASRLGLVEMSWNILCPSCGGVMDANATLKSVRQEEYHCAFCSMSSEPCLDDTVEVSFTVSPRVRRIAAHDPHGLSFWDYHRQVFFGSGVQLPEGEAFAALAGSAMLETLELQAGERMILALTLPAEPVLIFDPVTHKTHVIEISGEPTRERQDLALVFDETRPDAGQSTLHPGTLRLALDNRASGRVLPGIYIVGPALERLLAGRRPFLTAKRLLCNQTFRDIYRTDTMEVDQRLKVMSLSFLFTDLKGSTELYDRVGDLVAYDIVRAHFRVLNDIVASEGGAVVKTIGDAVMATFPQPHRAIAAALRMREAMRDLNSRHNAADLLLKIGIHEGPCLAVNLNDRQDYFGQTVNIASRVQALATTDRIYATEPVVQHVEAARLLESRHIEAAHREHALKGVGDRLPIYELA